MKISGDELKPLHRLLFGRPGHVSTVSISSFRKHQIFTVFRVNKSFPIFQATEVKKNIRLFKGFEIEKVCRGL